MDEAAWPHRLQPVRAGRDRRYFSATEGCHDFRDCLLQGRLLTQRARRIAYRCASGVRGGTRVFACQPRVVRDQRVSRGGRRRRRCRRRRRLRTDARRMAATHRGRSDTDNGTQRSERAGPATEHEKTISPPNGKRYADDRNGRLPIASGPSGRPLGPRPPPHLPRLVRVGVVARWRQCRVLQPATPTCLGPEGDCADEHRDEPGDPERDAGQCRPDQ